MNSVATTYKQEVKEKSRTIIWQHAVESLTKKRNEARVLNNDYLSKLSDFVEKRSGRIIDTWELNNYHHSLDIAYGQRGVEELKVAFFCGPEPENDVDVLLSLGIRLENMYASSVNRNSLAYLPILGEGEALLMGVDFPMPLTLKIIEPLDKPNSNTPKLKKK